MRVNLFREREFDFIWPTREPTPEQVAGGHPLIPVAERLKIKCKRLKHQAKRAIENSMFAMKGDQLERASKAEDTAGMSMSYSVGTIKDMRLRESIEDWENVLDADGNSIKFTWGAMTELLACNGDLDIEVYGSLETELLECIDKHVGFTESAKAPVKN